MPPAASTGLIRADGQPITRADVTRARVQAFNSLRAGRPNEGASTNGTFLRTWRPGLRSADADWLFDRDAAVARTRDLIRNEPVAASAVQRRINSAVGSGWRLSAKPDWRALGFTFEQARTLGQAIDAAWRSYANGVLFQADAERQLTFGQLLRMAASHVIQDGEALGLVEWAADEPTRFKTRLRIVDPDRLSNPNGAPDSPQMRGGIERNAHGVRSRYWIREGHPSDLPGLGFNSLVWKPWDVASTALGRPQVLHAFDKLRAGQSRGVSRFVAVLRTFRAFNRFSDATVEAATLDALFLGFVKSNAGLSAISESFTAEDLEKVCADRDAHYEENPISIDGVQLPVLGIDDEVDLKTTSRDTTGFDSFVRAILRLIAAALGVTYEELSMDFSQTNYSSARAAMLVAWNEVLALRELLRAQVVQPFYVAWLEEWFDQGHANDNLPAGAPDFYDAIDAYAAASWTGPGRGFIDPTKEIDAAAARIEAGISTLERETAELMGEDWEETLAQQAREQARRVELGLQPWGPALAEAGRQSRDPLRDPALEQKPANAALARVRATARSPEHQAELDRRSVA